MTFRRLNDPTGDTGPFLIFVLESAQRAKDVVRRILAAGLRSAVRLAEYGMHIYSNIPQLVKKAPLSAAGNPWNLPQNQKSVYDYALGACPRSDDLFARAILLPIPSRLTMGQEQQAASILQAALSSSSSA